MMQRNRTLTGGRIDRNREMSFIFDGRELRGFAGDTVASALLANNVRLVGRSFKYHRPRGIYSAGPEEPNALVTVIDGALREPNIPATMLELRPGLAVESQNRWPSLSFDIQSINGVFSRFLSAGFYYKTFMGPTKKAWMFYEHFIRKAAGLGRSSDLPDPAGYEIRNLFADVAVIGAGPAGLAAASAAAASGARVIVIDQDHMLGGSLLSEPADGQVARWLAERVSALAAMPSVRLMPRMTAFGVYDHNTLGLLAQAEPEGAGKPRLTFAMLRATAIVFATGAIEQPLAFANNDRPGVMLASAARTYLNRFSVLAGEKIIVATNNDSAYRVAHDFAKAGAAVTLLDTRETVPHAMARQMTEAGIDLHGNAWLRDLRGGKSVEQAIIQGNDGQWKRHCNLVCVSGGWVPAVHLTSHLGMKPRYDEKKLVFVPEARLPGQFIAGGLAGQFMTAAAIADGHAAGEAAAAYCGKASTAPILQPIGEIGGEASPAAFGRIPAARGKAFVDLQMDVTTDDIELAHREGYQSVEHLKRYTTLGMGTDQGKTSNMNALSAMARLRGSTVPEAGTTTFRPPYTPVAIGALAGGSVGRHFRPIRRTPMHDWHLANGAEMLEVGLWMRPYFYRPSGKTAGDAYVAEMRYVRNAAGLMDISTLGKIDIQGPDAARFLNRVYANGFESLPVGRARYGVMLRDDGIVFDDGTTTRLSANQFFMTTSTSKAADVMSWLEFLLDTAWTDLRVAVTSVTDEWAGMSVAGPRSRDILQRAFPSLDLSNDALPHMGMLEGVYGGRTLRILRLSYSGERAYEIYVGASQGRAVWEHLIAVGDEDGLQPYGVEALGALRVEKGHVAGPEIDGRTSLADLGLGRMVAKRSGFVGEVLGRRPAFGAADRQRLVGLECIDPGKRLRGGAILFNPDDRIEGHGRGRVTSVTYSPTLEKYVGLALLAANVAAEGREVLCVYPMKDEVVRARIVSPVFLDPAGERLHG